MLEQLFKGQTIRLTALRESDLETIKGWTEDSIVSSLASSNTSYPRSDIQIKNRIERSQSNQDSFYFAIRPLEEETLLGTMALDEIEWNNGVAGISIEIGDRDNHRQGIGIDSIKLLLDFAFLELNLRKLQLTVFDYNEAAIGLYKKIGFINEGTFREFGLRFNKTYDMLLFGILRSEWLSQYPAGYTGSINLK